MLLAEPVHGDGAVTAAGPRGSCSTVARRSGWPEPVRPGWTDFRHSASHRRPRPSARYRWRGAAPGSDAEKRLEAALAAQSWAAGRRWNQSYQSHRLAAPVRLDLLWPDERCVVEIDGPEHCRPVRFEADRQRDVQLQLDGYAVLRFTNARVIHDVGTVVTQIGTYLRARRRDLAEGLHHGRR
ncbi:DUF559 domain-containing protein [Micromonospora sp. BRA006-A]|nr:DUF559 domain-containing protein [Micromonospora sp. BRA006-A]